MKHTILENDPAFVHFPYKDHDGSMRLPVEHVRELGWAWLQHWQFETGRQSFEQTLMNATTSYDIIRHATMSLMHGQREMMKVQFKRDWHKYKKGK